MKIGVYMFWNIVFLSAVTITTFILVTLSAKAYITHADYFQDMRDNFPIHSTHEICSYGLVKIRDYYPMAYGGRIVFVQLSSHIVVEMKYKTFKKMVKEY